MEETAVRHKRMEIVCRQEKEVIEVRITMFEGEQQCQQLLSIMPLELDNSHRTKRAASVKLLILDL